MDNKPPKMSFKDRINDFVSRLGIFGELMRFLWMRKLWWLIPMIVALIAFGALIIFGSTPAGQFIYSLF